MISIQIKTNELEDHKMTFGLQRIRCLLWVLLIIMAFVSPATGQTIGLILQSEQSFNGYTLLAPSASRTTYLIDNCGFHIHEWVSDFTPGLSAYLLDDGSLLRPARIPGVFNGGGSGGRIERIGWSGDLIWAYDLATSIFHQHHDVEYLPNGNILVILWDLVQMQAAVNAGREIVNSDGIWSTWILEIEPVGSDRIEIIWEWKAWDHLIQDVDTLLSNFGVIRDHPERIDVNLDAGFSMDWLHVNGIDYNPELDQIAISVHDIDEIFIIDHSTTLEEAQESEGGKYGKGGDILYRYGNPANYGAGTPADLALFGQHDVRWIEAGLPSEGSLMVFNNGVGRTGNGNVSTVDVWMPLMDSAGYYSQGDSAKFGPTFADWSVGDGGDVTFFSARISGAHRLPNGNTLICSGREGNLLEVNEEGDLVWNYINPVSSAPQTQGQSIFGNDMFRATRYGIDHPAFEGATLIPGLPLELMPLDYECMIFTNLEESKKPDVELTLFPNPSSEFVTISIENKDLLFDYSVVDIHGRIVLKGITQSDTPISVNHLPTGTYTIAITKPKEQIRAFRKLVVF